MRGSRGLEAGRDDVSVICYQLISPDSARVRSRRLNDRISYHILIMLVVTLHVARYQRPVFAPPVPSIYATHILSRNRTYTNRGASFIRKSQPKTVPTSTPDPHVTCTRGARRDALALL